MNYFEIKYPGLNLIQRTEYSKLTITNSPFAIFFDKEKLLKDFDVCIIEQKDDFSKILPNNSLSLNTEKINCSDIKYLFIRREFDGEILSNANSIPLEKIETVFISDQIKEIFCATFSKSSLKYIYIPENIEKIKSGAFRECPFLEVVLLDSNCDVPPDCFQECTKLKTVILNDKIENINQDAFMGCIRLENIGLPKSLKKIESYAFANTSIKEIILPNQLETIERGVFKFSKIENLVIPSSAKAIKNDAFNGCPLKKVVFEDISNLKLGECVFTSKNCEIIIKENDKEKAKKWIEENRSAFKTDCIKIVPNTSKTTYNSKDSLDDLINEMHKQNNDYKNEETINKDNLIR